MLSDRQLYDVCLLYQGANQCRYLTETHNEQRFGWDCVKHCVNHKKIIDEKTKEYITNCKLQMVDPKMQPYAIEDNCQGYPYLINIEQGYDK